jgi:hypothetical protein
LLRHIVTRHLSDNSAQLLPFCLIVPVGRQIVSLTARRIPDPISPGGPAAVLPRRSPFVPKDQIMLKRVIERTAGFGIGLLILGIVLGTFPLGGCRKERVVDVQTPVGDVQVDKDRLNGDVDVKVDTD